MVLEAGADLRCCLKSQPFNIQDEYGWSALMIAAMQGRDDSTALVIASSARLNQIDRDRRYALHMQRKKVTQATQSFAGTGHRNQRPGAQWLDSADVRRLGRQAGHRQRIAGKRRRSGHQDKTRRHRPLSTHSRRAAQDWIIAAIAVPQRKLRSLYPLRVPTLFGRNPEKGSDP
ncbi:ankyrin repeat domain-containing protein [Thiorhodovibrio winogradskyi]|uniref:ankyrin repeat domain-containing protein n=1 Tax=Thiorhodovibrio winogradskyi TaxID=77007 RepID=UPI001F5DF5CD|nr:MULTISPECIES: ankyrin repeat domain-containing protein [Thiorhodovibrio]